MLIVRGQGGICNSNVFHCRGWLAPHEVSSVQQMETEVTYSTFDWVLVRRQTVFSPARRGVILCFSGFLGYRTQKTKSIRCFSLVLFGPHRFILSLGHPIF